MGAVNIDLPIPTNEARASVTSRRPGCGDRTHPIPARLADAASPRAAFEASAGHRIIRGIDHTAMPIILTHTRAARGSNLDPPAPRSSANQTAGVNATLTPPAGPCDEACTGNAPEPA